MKVRQASDNSDMPRMDAAVRVLCWQWMAGWLPTPAWLPGQRRAVQAPWQAGQCRRAGVGEGCSWGGRSLKVVQDAKVEEGQAEGDEADGIVAGQRAHGASQVIVGKGDAVDEDLRAGRVGVRGWVCQGRAGVGVPGEMNVGVPGEMRTCGPGGARGQGWVCVEACQAPTPRPHAAGRRRGAAVPGSWSQHPCMQTAPKPASLQLLPCQLAS